MNRDRMEENWKRFKGNVKQRWFRLTKIYPICKIDESHGITRDQRDFVGQWQNHQKKGNHQK